MKKVKPYFLILLALVTIVTGLYGYYLKHMSQQLVENWMRIEQVSIQQGNIFSSLATSNRILMSSGAIRSVMLFDIQHEQVNEMASYGEYISITDFPKIDPGTIESVFDGAYRVQTFVRFKERPNLVAVFRTESPDSFQIFIFFLSILTLMVVGFALYIQSLARKEETRRLAVIKSAMEDLVEEVPPRQFIVNQIPHILSNWNSIRDVFDQLKSKLETSARDRLIAQTSQMLGHDLRAPLGTFEKLLTIPDHEFPAMRRPIRESLNRVYAMIEALRNYEIESLIHKSICLFDFNAGLEIALAKAEGVGVKIKAPFPMIYELELDKEKVNRAWLNLVLNAIEFAKSEVLIDVLIDGGDFMIRVCDDGNGVPDEFVSKLFQRGATYGKADGTGLGLAYVRQIMRGHGGDVLFRRENGWTIFECKLPDVLVSTRGNSLNSQNFDLSLRKAQIKKKVALCFKPESLSESLLASLSSQETENFLFSYDYKSADIVATNDPECALDAIEDGKEPLEFSSNLVEITIIAMLKRRFHLV
jgi:signal transduction histidine kinase